MLNRLLLYCPLSVDVRKTCADAELIKAHTRHLLVHFIFQSNCFPAPYSCLGKRHVWTMEPEQEEELSNYFNRLKLDRVPGGGVASPQLTLLEFTLFADSEHAGKDPHVILHFPQPSSKTLDMESVDISLINDKLPSGSHIPKESSFLVKYWGDLDFSEQQFPSFFITTRLQSGAELRLGMKTEICMFGQSIGEKMEGDWTVVTNASQSLFQYEMVRSSLCPFLANFIRKLKADCSDSETMNGVLENFSVIQVVTNQDTEEVLLFMAYVFEVCSPELSASTGAMCSVYKLSGTST